MSRFDIRPEGAPLFLHIAAGVAIGVLVAAGVIWMCWLLQLRLVADEAAKQAQQAAARVHAEQQRQAEDAQARELQRRTTEAAAQRTAEERKRHAADEAQRKDLAWSRFYVKPARCDESRGGNWSVDCANEYMRAKRAFEELYSAGKL